MSDEAPSPEPSPPPSRFPRLPDWAVYAIVAVVVVWTAVSRREHADAPPPPPPIPGAEQAPLGPDSPFKAKSVRRVTPAAGRPTESGTAFSISEDGVWLTARHVIAGCAKVAVIVAEGRGVIAKVAPEPRGDVAVLRTEGGSPPLPLALDAPIQGGQRAFHAGFPGGIPGEATSLYLGADSLRDRARFSRPQPVLVWAETGRTDGMSKASLAGLSGAPVLDSAGQVVGLTLAESTRRGRIYAAPPRAIREALAHARAEPKGFAPGQPITVENYGRAADALRRDLRVARVVCLA